MIAGTESWQGAINNGSEVQREARTYVNTATSIPPTGSLPSARVFATSTPKRPRATSIPPATTTVPPSDTSIPPTATPIPPTRTFVPPTATPIPPSRTPVPTTAPAFSVNRYSSPQTRYTHGTVNLREGPDTSYDLVGSVAVNTALQIVGKSGDWYLIRHNGAEVFIAGWLTFDAPLQHHSSQPANPQPPAQQPAARAQQPALQPAAPQEPSYSCTPRKNCSDMSSCAEARYHLTQCGRGGLDRDNDGVPCESICR
ncbi:MAG: SH3 domain-containing protein [Chloroflexi bacterium]|nr:SH3 domain-containing protein [Chloroflexota bacterium]